MMKNKDVVDNFINALAHQNVLILGDWNTGKTSLLLSICEKMLSNHRIYAIDSATEHVNKSLIIKLRLKHESVVKYIKAPPIDMLYKDNLIPVNAYPSAELDNKKSIYLFDVSTYLEESYHYMGEMRIKHRELYRAYTFQILFAIINTLPLDTKAVVIMDEIEINDTILSIILRLNERGIFVCCCAHDTPALQSNDLHKFFMVKNLSEIWKPAEMSCGSSCVWYIENMLLRRVTFPPNKLFWVAHIADYLNTQDNLETELYCYRSTYYRAYLRQKKSNVYADDESNSLFYLYRYISKGGILHEKKVDFNSLKQWLDNGWAIMVLVNSSMYFKDPYRRGMHYVLVIGCNKNTFYVMSPGKNKLNFSNIIAQDLLHAMRHCGNWALKVRITH